MAYECAVVEVAVGLGVIDYEVARRGCRLERVVNGEPGDLNVAAVGHDGGHGCRRRQWLNYGVVYAVQLTHAAEYAFVDGSREQEFEIGVVCEAEVGVVLMREHLEDYCRHGGLARLAVVAVVHLPARPAIVGECVKVGADLRECDVAEVA